MVTKMARRLKEFFEERTAGDLRSVVVYEQNEFEVSYLRDDVAAEYTEREVATAVDDTRTESLMAPVYGDLYTDDHDDLICTIKVFPSVVEMNFVRSSAEGVAVALDAGVFEDSDGLVTEARAVAADDQL
ncbi:hypothetical protein [Haloferax larsenii]|uniref:Uncharacterized protein n=1 Tax=Haloferax larsenii TaxID=302484 RepID=A0A1H7IP43_HALLR|nr:hypothetical protein [Haloferax larsenii]SEK63662.1 hypothetical protein SAMN04488691_101953 [Haloferax larsenii]